LASMEYDTEKKPPDIQGEIFIDFTAAQSLKQYNADELLRELFIPFNHFIYFTETSPIGPLIISIVRVTLPDVAFRALIRTSRGFVLVEFGEDDCQLAWWRRKLGLYPPPDELFIHVERVFVEKLKISAMGAPLLRKMASIQGRAFGDPDCFTLLEANETINMLQVDCDQKLFRVATQYKFGVLYTKEGQQDENDIYSNVSGSKDFELFLDFLGDKVQLQGWQGYGGELDLRRNATGTHSVYSKWGDYIEIMFHVSTYLPAGGGQQIERKRHIGNDLVVIVFQDKETPFRITTLTSQQTHVYIIIHPIKLNDAEDTSIYYKVEIQTKNGVAPFGPFLGGIYPADQKFRDLLYSKLLNAEVASFTAPPLIQPVAKSKDTWLKELTHKYQQIPYF